MRDSESLEGDEWTTYVVLVRTHVTECRMTYKGRPSWLRSLDSTRRSHARPGKPGELATGGSQAGAEGLSLREVREMRFCHT